MLSRLFNSFKKTNYTLPDFYTTDLHSHLIPAIDNGSQSMEQSIEMIKELKGMGFKKLITTPHIMPHRYPNTKDEILKAFDNLQNELLKQNVDIQMEVASEYYYDEHFIELIRNKDLLTFGDNNVLTQNVEHSPIISTKKGIQCK